MDIDITPIPVRHGQTPARRLHLPESECSGEPDAASSSATCRVPTGQPDNSPAFQRRVFVGTGISPAGTAELGRPAGTWNVCGIIPALKCRAIIIASLCDTPKEAEESSAVRLKIHAASRTRFRWATWAWMAASSPTLTIAQPFMAGFTVRNRRKSRQGRKMLAHGHHCLPSLTGLGKLDCVVPSHKWLGYFHIQVKQKTRRAARTLTPLKP
jgi:hypothetical protein